MNIINETPINSDSLKDELAMGFFSGFFSPLIISIGCKYIYTSLLGVKKPFLFLESQYLVTHFFHALPESSRRIMLGVGKGL